MTVYYKLPPTPHTPTPKLCCEAENRFFLVEKREHFCSKAFQQDKQTALTTAATRPVALVLFIADIRVPLTWQMAVLQ
jgi:hypothetical protein